MLESITASLTKQLNDLGLLPGRLADALRIADIATTKGLADARNIGSILRFLRGQYPSFFGPAGGNIVSEALKPLSNPRDGGTPVVTTTTTLVIAPKDSENIPEADETPEVTPPVVVAPAAPAVADPVTPVTPVVIPVRPTPPTPPAPRGNNRTPRTPKGSVAVIATAPVTPPAA